MRHIHRLLFMLGIVAIVITAPYTKSYAAFNEDISPYAAHYTELISSKFAEYYVPAQPDDVIILKDETTLSLSDRTDLYPDNIVFNLPRLRNGYYYVTDTTTNQVSYLDIPSNSVYPILCLHGSVEAESTKALKIYHRDNDLDEPEVVATISLKFATTMSSTSDIVITNPVIELDSEGNLVYEDVRQGKVTFYNHNLHKCAAITDSNVFLFSKEQLAPDSYVTSDFYLDSNKELKAIDQSNVANTVTSTIVDCELNTSFTNPDSSVVTDLFKLAKYSFNNLRQTVISTYKYNGAISNYFDDARVLYDYTKGTYQRTIKDPADGHFFFFTDGIVYHYIVKVEDYFDDSAYWRSNVEPISTSTISYEEPWLQSIPVTEYYTTNSSIVALERPLVTEAFTDDIYYMPYFNFINAGKETYKLKFSDANNLYQIRLNNAYSVETLIEARSNVKIKYPIPVREKYEFGGWYLDEEFKEKAPDVMVRPLNDIVDVYAKWTWSGGNYNVHFLDRKNKTESTTSFQCDKQPTFPENPVYPGYNFKNWEILRNADAVTGTGFDYNPETFEPVEDATYYFNAEYATIGAVLSVTNSKSEYYIGDSIDKDKLTVTIATDDNGSTRVLNNSEFSLSPNKVMYEGNNEILVKYDATGSSRMISVVGIVDTIKGITVKYTGGAVTVGNAPKKSDIVVKANYASGKTETISEYALTPSTVVAVGTNTFKVIYGKYSATFIVTGKSNVHTPIQEGKSVTGLNVAYEGDTPYEGDDLKASDLKVTALYNDGSKEIIDSSKFSYTPKRFSSVGANTFYITYSGKSVTLTLNASAKKSSQSLGSSQSSNESHFQYHDNVPMPESSSNNDNDHEQSTSDAISDSNSNYSNSLNSLLNKGKGASPWYIDGKTILDTNTGTKGSVVDTTIYNTVDILEEVKNASKKADKIIIDLVNGAVGNEITNEVFHRIQSLKIPLHIRMYPDTSLTEPVFEWVFDNISGDLYDTDYFDPNVFIEEYLKAGETIYFVSAYQNNVYDDSVTSTLFLKDKYITGTYVKVYSVSDIGDSAKYLQDYIWNSRGEMKLDFAKTKNYAISNNITKYPDGSDMRAGLSLNPVSNKTPTYTTDGVVKVEEDTQDDNVEVEVTEPVVTEEDLIFPEVQDQKSSKSIFIIVAGIIILIIVIIITVFIVEYNRMKHDDNLDDNDDNLDDNDDDNSLDDDF